MNLQGHKVDDDDTDPKPLLPLPTLLQSIGREMFGSEVRIAPVARKAVYRPARACSPTCAAVRAAKVLNTRALECVVRSASADLLDRFHLAAEHRMRCLPRGARSARIAASPSGTALPGAMASGLDDPASGEKPSRDVYRKPQNRYIEQHRNHAVRYHILAHIHAAGRDVRRLTGGGDRE